MENLESETFQTWDKLADLYWEKFSKIRIYDHTYDNFTSYLPDENPTVLDVGCGPGIIAHNIKSQKKNARLTGVDVSPNMIRKATEMVEGFEGHILKIQDIGRLSQTFQGIICGFGLPYLNHNEAQDFINLCYAMLEDTGVLYISFVEGDLQGPEIKKDHQGNRILFYYHQTETLLKCLESTGFFVKNKWVIPYPSPTDFQQEHIVLLATKTA